jgi:hypothetical protein
LATCIDHAHGLFSKYYELTDKTEAYVVAMVLDPRQTYKYLFDHWQRIYYAGVKKKTETMYKEFRIDNDVAASLSMANSRQSRKRKVDKSDDDDDDDDNFDIIAHRFGKNDIVQDELERYLKAPTLPVSTQEQGTGRINAGFAIRSEPMTSGPGPNVSCSEPEPTVQGLNPS